MNAELDSVEKQVVGSLRKFQKRPKRWGAPKLNKEVNVALCDVGEHLGFNVHCKETDGGRLFDLCWQREDDAGIVLGTPLAMECELSPDCRGILKDFQKLLVSRAEHRIFICRLRADVWSLCADQLLGQVCSYHGSQNGDRYLLACWTEDGWQFRPYVHHLAPPPAAKRVWLFSANPKYEWDPLEKVKARKVEDWHALVNVEFLQPGDVALIWRTATAGREAGIYGLGELASAAYEDETGEYEWRVDIRYTGLLKQPILKSTLSANPALANLSVLRMPRSKNPSRVTPEEWKALQKLAWLRPSR
jgi:predicted RNA-binding protein with PUA-like domain